METDNLKEYVIRTVVCNESKETKYHVYRSVEDEENNVEPIIIINSIDELLEFNNTLDEQQ